MKQESWRDKTFSIGTYAEIAKRQNCIVCTLVLGLLSSSDDAQSRWHSQLRPQEYAINATKPHRGLLKTTGLPPKVTLKVVDNAGRHYGQIRSTWDYGYPKIVNNPLDPARLRAWISDCETSHCEDLDASIYIDITLIDVVDQCLVRATTRYRYVSLSYVWGGISGLRLMVANRFTLEEPGAFSLRETEIPQLVNDAMHLVCQMNERYLWVDRLCIEQDNPLQKHFSISKMDTVYTHSLATVCVLSAFDANSQIPGVLKQSRRPISKITFLSYPEESDRAKTSDYMMSYPCDFKTEFIQSAYETRAWTLQERLLSRRCIFFTERMAYFYCSHGNMYCDGDELLNPEDRITGGNQYLRSLIDPIRLGSRTNETGPEATWKQVLIAYTALVHQYTARHLSFDTDSLNAFSGILSTLLKQVTGKAIGGLPEYLLDYCLLWLHTNPSKRSQYNPIVRNTNFPSWSWAGWSGGKSYFGGPLYLNDFAVREYEISNRKPHTDLISEIEELGTSSETPVRPVMRLSNLTTNPSNVSSLTGGLSLDILHFQAGTCSASNFIDMQPNSVMQSLRLRQGSSRSVGVVYHFLSPSTTASSIDFLLLSRVPCPLHRRRFGRSGAQVILSKYMNSSLCLDSECYLAHLMIVQWHGDRAERLGLATIQAGEWNKLETVKKEVILI